jgi:hypothetical protein
MMPLGSDPPEAGAEKPKRKHHKRQRGQAMYPAERAQLKALGRGTEGLQHHPRPIEERRQKRDRQIAGISS